MAVKLRPHQEAVLKELSPGKVLVGGVGSGKTITSLVWFYTKVMGGTLGDMGSLTNPMDLYVFTTARKRDSLDWQKEAAQLGIGREIGASVPGCVMTVDSYNNIAKYKDVTNAFIILDEQRMVGAGAWTKAFLKMAKSNDWIMLSATPGDTWEDYIALFIANGFYKNRTEFKRTHCVYSYFNGRYPKLERYVEVGTLVRHRNAIQVEMPYERHTTRHIHEMFLSHDKDLFERVLKKRWNPYEARPLRDVAELFGIMRKVVNSDSSRTTELEALMSKHPRLIVFYNFDYELQILRTFANSLGAQSPAKTPIAPTVAGVKESVPVTGEGESWSQDAVTSKSTVMETGGNTATTSTTQSGNGSQLIPSLDHTTGASQLIFAEWNGHKHEEVPTSERWIYAVQYVAGAEAWNCTTTNAEVFYSLTYSYKNFHQAMGRIDRLDTPYFDLHYYVFLSNSVIDRAILKALKNKKSFNEKDYALNT